MAFDPALDAARPAVHGHGNVFRWLFADPSVAVLCAVAVLFACWAATDTTPVVFRHLWTWTPTLLRGMLANIGISVLAMALGTVVGLIVGALSLSPHAVVRGPASWWTQSLRNAPILVLVYFTTYVFPFEVHVARWIVAFPDWLKVVVALALPASANVAEIFRGAILSIPQAQWEAARSLAMRRSQIFAWIVLPQCVRRMLPPWMNLYASITMSTALASLVGVHDVVDTAQVASNTVATTDFTILVYFTLLALFFAYCYPIARATRALERRHERH